MTHPGIDCLGVCCGIRSVVMLGSDQKRVVMSLVAGLSLPVRLTESPFRLYPPCLSSMPPLVEFASAVERGPSGFKPPSWPCSLATITGAWDDMGGPCGPAALLLGVGLRTLPTLCRAGYLTPKFGVSLLAPPACWIWQHGWNRYLTIGNRVRFGHNRCCLPFTFMCYGEGCRAWAHLPFRFASTPRCWSFPGSVAGAGVRLAPLQGGGGFPATLSVALGAPRSGLGRVTL